MGVINNYDDAVKELFYWQFNQGEGSDFNSMIFRLIQKAQSTPVNMRKLERGFPFEVQVMKDWYSAKNHGNDLFALHGLYPKGREKEFKEGLAKTDLEDNGKTYTDNFNKWMEEHKNE
jgi:hypothetical protein